MDQMRIERLDLDDVPGMTDVVLAMRRERRGLGPEDAYDESGEQRAALLKEMRWRIFNEVIVDERLVRGYGVRGRDGALDAMNLHFPVPYRYGDQDIVGFCQSALYVGPNLRKRGLANRFERMYHETPGQDFCYATTSNKIAIAVWYRVGVPVPYTTCQTVILVRPARLVAQNLLSKKVPSALRSLITIGAGAADWPYSWTVSRRSDRLLASMEQSTDLERLATVAERHRDPTRLCMANSASFLRWRYHDNPASYRTRIVRFSCTDGDEGWFALREPDPGRSSGVRVTTLLDMAIPRNKRSDWALLAALMSWCAGTSEGLLVGGSLQRWTDGLTVPGFKRRWDWHQAWSEGEDHRGRAWSLLLDIGPSAGDSLD